MRFFSIFSATKTISNDVPSHFQFQCMVIAFSAKIVLHFSNISLILHQKFKIVRTQNTSYVLFNDIEF